MRTNVIKRIISIFMVVTSIACIFAVNANAIAYTTPNHKSEAALAGSWHTDPTYTISSSYAQIYGGDVGVYYHAANYGLSNAFVIDTTRKVKVNLYESDSNSSTRVRGYTGTFAVTNGYYRPHTWSNTYTNGSKIESDNTAELYIKFEVETVSDDTSKNVASGIMYYQFWSN